MWGGPPGPRSTPSSASVGSGADEGVRHKNFRNRTLVVFVCKCGARPQACRIDTRVDEWHWTRFCQRGHRQVRHLRGGGERSAAAAFQISHTPVTPTLL